MKKYKKGILSMLLICVMAFATGCGGDRAQQLGERNKLPADGVITQEQMETIAGREGTYEFYATDEKSGIQYSWFYDGEKINNPVEQKLKVNFTTSKVDEVRKLADDAAVGIGFTTEAMSPAAPLTLKVTLTEKWDADAAILCKLVDGSPAQMAEAEISTVSVDGKDVTCLTFPVNETGDTYYLVGGRTAEGRAGTADAEEEGSGSHREGDEAAPLDAAGKSAAGVNKNGETDSAGTGGKSAAGGTKDKGSNSAAAHICTISIDCITLADNMDMLRKPEKASYVPADGWLLYPSTVEFTPGETVYDVLYRACRRAGYQMEASYTPMYGSYYIEGINQLYEFDAGNLSGWMYSVNGWYPNYGCSSYKVKDGDRIRFRYTCDLGRDIGGASAVE